MGSSVLFRLSQAQAKAVSWLNEAASSDQARPTLASINMEWVREDGELVVTFVATDSYLLATRALRFPADTYEAEPDEGTALVPAKRFTDALKSAVKHGPKAVGPKATEMQDTLVEITEDGANVASVNGDYFESIRLIEGDFPNWRQLIPERDDKPVTVLSPHNLWKATRIVSQPVSDKDAKPMRVYITDPLKPVIFEVIDSTRGTGDLTVLVMPVRL